MENGETERRDAWLRELLTDSESGRWIAEMTGSRDREQCELRPEKTLNV
jgi:hypothetical protein